MSSSSIAQLIVLNIVSIWDLFLLSSGKGNPLLLSVRLVAERARYSSSCPERFALAWGASSTTGSTLLH